MVTWDTVYEMACAGGRRGTKATAGSGFRESYAKVLILSKGPRGRLATPFLFFSLPLISPPPKVTPTISNPAKLLLLHSQTCSELGQRTEHMELPPVPLPLVLPEGKFRCGCRFLSLPSPLNH